MELTQQDKHELVELYHLAKTALSYGSGLLGPDFEHHSRYDRMVWAAKEYSKAHPSCPASRAYTALDRELHHKAVS